MLEHRGKQERSLSMSAFEYVRLPSFPKSSSIKLVTTRNKWRLHRKLLLLLIVCLVSLSLSILNALFRDIPQSLLQHQALDLQQASSFNPRIISLNLYSYIERCLNEEKQHHKLPHSTADAILGNDKGIYFHWDDWVDMFSEKSILPFLRDHYPDGHCIESAEKSANVNPYFMESYITKVRRSMTNLYCSKDIPKNVLVATDEGYFKVPVLSRRRIGLFESPQHVSKMTIVLEMERCDILKDSAATEKGPQIVKSSGSPIRFIPKKPFKNNIAVSPNDFVFEPEAQLFMLKDKLNGNTILTEELQYLEFLETSNQKVDTADRFFKYPWIYGDVVAGRSHHIYSPFFKRYIPDRERQSILQHMIRSWFRFAATEDVASWINSGSLLGWAFNGVNMPWDTDTDIQLPIAQLDRLSRKYNNTIITENPRDGNAVYLFEVSPTYIRQGNGRNFIDARFIDINTGVYLDISALSHTNDQPPSDIYKSNSDISRLKAMAVHCKHWNWLLLDELLPLRHTHFEGSSIYVPRNVSAILLRQYGSESFTTKMSFNDHDYRSDLGMWVPQKTCSPSRKQFNSQAPEQLWLSACGALWLFDEFRITHPYSELHQLNNLGPDHLRFEELGPEFSLHRKDAWDYYNDINNKAVTNLDWYINVPGTPS